MAVLRGIGELRRLVEQETFDLRRLDLAGFRRWLALHVTHWRSDPVFLQRAKIRDLRQTHRELAALEEEHRAARTADEASPHFERLFQLAQQWIDTGKAVAGLTAALDGASPERERSLRRKLDTFQVRREALAAEQEALIRLSPQRQKRLLIEAELQPLREAIGLDQEELLLKRLNKEQGIRSTRGGASFERLALMATEIHVVPELQGRNPASAHLRVLRGITLGAARTELDQLVVRLRGDHRPVDVLAMVEVKRNINDVASGFRHRQENLAWLTGDVSRYDPRQCRTRVFPTGHFDREVVHQQHEERFVLGPESFRRFHREPGNGFFINRLYLATRLGRLWGASAAALARMRFRAATDERWQLDSDIYLGSLLDWCRSLTEPLETPDVLEMYASTSLRARQVLLLDRKTSPEQRLP